jgi:hypothetical protein
MPSGEWTTLIMEEKVKKPQKKKVNSDNYSKFTFSVYALGLYIGGLFDYMGKISWHDSTMDN